MDTNHIIETSDLGRTFKTRQGPLKAVAGLDLRVAPGEIFGFLGPNGAGKTTTLRMLSTLLPPTHGRASVAGFDLLREPQQVRERIGFVGQRGGSDPAVSGHNELVFQGRCYGMSSAEARRRAAELITTLELESCADRPTGSYSGGQGRRLDIAMGLVHRPRLVFLDEPTSGLDPQGRARLWEEIRRLRREGMSVFLTTHYLEEADALCDRLAIIDHGKIVAEGTPDQLKRQIAGDVVKVGVGGNQEAALELLGGQPYVREATSEDGALRLAVDHGEAVMPAILRLLDGAGFDLQTISLSRPSLDDVFLRMTGRSLRETAA
jgi:ABC-2 type transport system ATP-binding protein